MIDVDGHIFPDCITAKTPGALNLSILNEAGEDLAAIHKIESIDMRTGLAIVFVKNGKKLYRRPVNFGKVTLKLKL